MDRTSTVPDNLSTNIGRLTNANNHSWKIRTLHLSTLNHVHRFVDDVYNHISEENHFHGDNHFVEDTSDVFDEPYYEKERTAQAVLGLSLSHGLPESVREFEIAQETWPATNIVLVRQPPFAQQVVGSEEVL